MAETTTSQHGQWSSRWAFILAATGSAVGLGNIWKFPYIVGENGGGAFVMVYLFCVLVMGIPLMMAEIMLGRRGKQSPVNTMKQLASEAGADSRWSYLGWLGVIAGFLILAYYSVVAGWALAYTGKAFFGHFINSDAAEIATLFEGLIASPWQQVFWHTVFITATMAIVVRGVEGGLEKAVRFLMPALFVLMFLLVGYAMTTGAYAQGLSFLFQPDFSKLTGNVILTAMGQAFFSLSLGMGAIMVYGAYLPKKISIAKTAIIIAGADTCVALLAGLAIFPIVFANGLTPSDGPGLIFKTLPIAFGAMTGGWLVGVLFFLLLFFAALTSSISLIEPAVAWLVEKRNISRYSACIWSGLITWVVGIAVALSFNVWASFTLFDKNLFALLDYLTSNILLPIGGFCIALFAGWVMKQQHSEAELALSNPLFYQVWRFLVGYIAPTAVFLVFLHVIGVI